MRPLEPRTLSRMASASFAAAVVLFMLSWTGLTRYAGIGFPIGLMGTCLLAASRWRSPRAFWDCIAWGALTLVFLLVLAVLSFRHHTQNPAPPPARLTETAVGLPLLYGAWVCFQHAAATRRLNRRAH